MAAAVQTTSWIPSRSLEPEEGPIAAAPARTEAAMTAPTIDVPTRMTARPAALNKHPPTTYTTSLRRRTLAPASTPFTRSVTPSMMASRPSSMTSGSTSTPPGFKPSGIDKYDGKPTLTCGYVATPLPSRPLEATTRPKSSTSLSPRMPPPYMARGSS